MNYTVAQVASMFGKKPTEISAVVRKGGIKGLTIEESDDGVRYLLSDQAVDQLGAMFGTSPKELKEAKEIRDGKRLISIDKAAFEKEVKRLGYKMNVMSKACGQAEGYISQALQRGRINPDVLDKLEDIFCFRTENVLIPEKPEPKEEPKPAEPQINTKEIAEAVRQAVFNGMTDAFIEIMKTDLLKTTMVRAYDSDEFRQNVNKAVYQAIKGLRKLDEMDSHPGLIPQRRPNA